MTRNSYVHHLRLSLAKKRLIDLAEKLGREHPRVLAYSRKVDKLVVAEQGQRLLREGVVR